MNHEIESILLGIQLGHLSEPKEIISLGRGVQAFFSKRNVGKYRLIGKGKAERI